jgi:hypothetical protein
LLPGFQLEQHSQEEAVVCHTLVVPQAQEVPVEEVQVLIAELMELLI